MQKEWTGLGYEATKIAWTANVSTSAQRLVLLCIARYANDQHISFPSVETICSDTLLNRKTVFKALKELQAIGILVVSKRSKNNSNSYSFARGTSTKNGSTENGSTEFGMSQKRNVGSTKNGTSVVPKTVHEQIKEQIKEQIRKEDAPSSYSKLTERIVSLYSEITTGYFSQIQAVTEKRKRSVKKFIDFYRKQVNAVDEAAFLSAVREYFCRAVRSPFLTGQNERGWRADFDFLMNENKALALLEGKYDGHAQAPASKPNIFTVPSSQRSMQIAQAENYEPDFALDSFGVAK